MCCAHMIGSIVRNITSLEDVVYLQVKLTWVVRDGTDLVIPLIVSPSA